MSNRGTIDESFIGQAFENVEKRDVADQSLYNGFKDDRLPSYQKSVFVTAVKFYEIKNILTFEHTRRAEQVETYGELRDLVDELNPIRLEYYKNHNE